MMEQDTRYIVDNNLVNKNWILDIENPNKNVFFERDILRIIDNPKLKKLKKRPDYVLMGNNKKPIAVIEAKAGGQNLDKALDQAMDYAEILETPLIFAMNNSYCQTRHLYTGSPLYINENEVNELIRQKEALKFLQENTNSIYTIPKKVIVSRQELIGVFKNLNNTLRGEGLRAGIERLSEFSNILFLKLYTENKADNVWESIKNVDNELLIDTVNQLLRHIEKKYGASVFTELHIKKPDTLREIINKLDKLTLSTIDTDIKGDAFEYFLQQATATSNDLGEYFTPRHITKTIVNLVNPKFKETVYDPFCGTGGFLTQAFNHIKDNTLINTEEEKERLKEQTVFGSEITTNSRLAKMNMILHGDGHSGVKQLDSLENPIDGKYDVVITNMPFAQKTQSAHLYYNGIAKNSGDGVCLLHCFKSVKKGGRMAVIVPEGVLFRDSLKNVRKFLIDNAVLQTVVSLPQGVFLPYAGVKTNILYFTDCHSKKTKDKIWFFNVRNDGFTLDNHRKRIKDNDLKKVDYVDFLKRYDKESFLDLGFSETNLEKIKKNKYSLVGSFYVDNKFRNKKGFLPLKDVICVLEAGSRPRGGVSNISTGAISLGGEHIGIDGRITLKNIKYVPKDFYNKCKKGFVKQFDILICKDGALTGKAALFNDISLFNQKDIMVNEHVYIVRGNDKINQKYLFYMLRSHNLQNQIKEKAFNKSAQPGLNQTIMQNLLIPMPLLKEQHDIVSALDKKEAFIHKKREEAKTMDQSLRDDINKIWDTEKEGLPDEFFSLLEKTVRPLEE